MADIQISDRCYVTKYQKYHKNKLIITFPQNKTITFNT